MKNILIITFLIQLMAFFPGCGKKKEPGRYYSNEKNFSIRFPDDWDIQENYMGTVVRAAAPLKDAASNFRNSINIVVEEIPENMDLDSYVDSGIEVLQKNLQNITSHYKLEQKTHIPSAGTGFYYIPHEKIALALQLGLLYTIPDINMTDMDGKGYYVWTRPTCGFNGEFTVNLQPIDSLIIQGGYRYQYFRLDAIQQQTLLKTESDDISHGPTLTAVWMF